MPDQMSAAMPTRVQIRPARLAGTVLVPGDKSISHRALLLGALTSGPTTVTGLVSSGDVHSTVKSLTALGAEIRLGPDESGSLGGEVSGPLREATQVLDCGNSGTGMRLLAGVAAGIDGLTVLTGDESLRARPMDRIAAPLRLMGAQVDGRDGGSLPPLVVRGGSLHGVDYESPVASAQVKSAVLLAGLSASGSTRVTSPMRSRDHTERMLAHLGADVERSEGADGREQVTLTSGQLASRPITVPRDPSSAAFWIVAAAPDIGSAAGEVVVPGLCVNPTRTGAIAVLREMGAKIEITDSEEICGEPVATVTVRPATLDGAVIEGARTVDALDELPVLAVVGAVSDSGLEVRDAHELRVKESDRIAGVAAMLRALGATVEERADGFLVPGGQSLTGGQVHARGDHRIAMAAAVAGTLASGPVTIDGFEVVGTSYPSFLDDFRLLGGEVDA